MNPIVSVGQGLFSRGVWEFFKFGLAYVPRRRYRRVFGRDVIRSGKEYIIVGALQPPRRIDSAGREFEHVFTKTGVPGASFSASVVIAQCELRAASYLSGSVALNAREWASVVIDEGIEEKLNISFVSIGLMNNLKTVRMLNSPENSLVNFNANGFISKVSGRMLIGSDAKRDDYGLILKVLPANHLGRTWICCGGFGEWGTSGAAWYLSHRWKHIESKFGANGFAVIVRVEPQHDESATPVIEAAKSEEIERFTR